MTLHFGYQEPYLIWSLGTGAPGDGGWGSRPRPAPDSAQPQGISPEARLCGGPPFCLKTNAGLRALTYSATQILT